jgi:hypothetical protein
MGAGGALQIILDVSRLIDSAQRATPTGIDRVELAYAKHFCAEPRRSCAFVAEVPILGLGALPHAIVAELVVAAENSWAHGDRSAAAAIRRARLAAPFGRGVWSFTEGHATTYGLDAGSFRFRLVVDRLAGRRPAGWGLA